MAAWRYVICDVAGVSLGQLAASARWWKPGVCRIATAGCQIHETDPMYASATAEGAHLRVYNSQGVLVYFGPVLTTEEVGNGQVTTCALTSADMLFNMTTFFGAIDDGSQTYRYTLDGAKIAKAWVKACHDSGCGGPGFQFGTITGTFPDRDVTYLWKNGFEVLSEMSAIGGSFEWQIALTDNGPAVAPTSDVNLLAKIGADKSASVFLEYGAGTKANCATFNRIKTKEKQANWVYAVGGASPAGSVRDTSLEATYGLARMDVVTYSDVGDNTLLTALAQAHVDVRKAGREIITLGSTALDAPVYGADYVYGDTVTARVRSGAGWHVDGPVRVWGVTVNINEEEAESPVWELMP